MSIYINQHESELNARLLHRRRGVLPDFFFVSSVYLFSLRMVDYVSNENRYMYTDEPSRSLLNKRVFSNRKKKRRKRFYSGRPLVEERKELVVRRESSRWGSYRFPFATSLYPLYMRLFLLCVVSTLFFVSKLLQPRASTSYLQTVDLLRSQDRVVSDLIMLPAPLFFPLALSSYKSIQLNE